MKKLICVFLTLNLLLTSAFAQDGGDDFVKNTQNDLMLVGGAGVAGAILGLSTLSFVDKPSKHIANVWTGAAIGVIVGVIYVAYNSAQRGQEDLESSIDFKTSERVAWHQSHEKNLTFPGVHFGSQIWGMNF